MKSKHKIESVLHCIASEELSVSVENDLQQSDGSLKELLNDRSPTDQNNSSDRGTSELSE